MERLYILLCTLIFDAAIVLSPLFSSAVLRKHLWSIDHFGDFPLPLRLIVAAFVTALAVGGVNRSARRAIGRAGTIVSKWTRPSRYLLYALIALLSFPAFWGLRNRDYTLGDSTHLIEILTWDVHTRGYHVTYDEPMELYVHSLAYRALHTAFGWDVARSYALVSALCGVAVVLLLLLLAESVVGGPGRWLFVLLPLCTGWAGLFFGCVENYTLVAAGVIAYVVLGRQHLEGRCRLAWPALILSISFCLHVLAGWLFPSLVYLYFSGWREHDPPARARRLAEMLLAVLVPIACTIGYLAAIGYGPGMMRNTHLAGLKFIPLLDPSYTFYQYEMFSLQHLTDILNQIVLVALPGLLIWPFMLLFHRDRIDGNDRFLRFLLLIAVFCQIFVATWNPDLGAYNDWDLFAILSVGYVLSGAYLLTRPRTWGRIRYAMLVFLAISAAHGGLWIVRNASRDVYVIDRHDAAHLAAGNIHLREGDLSRAIVEYEEALRLAPQSPSAHLNLGIVHLRQDDLRTASEFFEEALRLAPHHPEAPRIRETLEQIRRRQEAGDRRQETGDQKQRTGTGNGR